MYMTSIPISEGFLLSRMQAYACTHRHTQIQTHTHIDTHRHRSSHTYTQTQIKTVKRNYVTIFRSASIRNEMFVCMCVCVCVCVYCWVPGRTMWMHASLCRQLIVLQGAYIRSLDTYFILSPIYHLYVLFVEILYQARFCSQISYPAILFTMLMGFLMHGGFIVHIHFAGNKQSVTGTRWYMYVCASVCLCACACVCVNVMCAYVLCIYLCVSLWLWVSVCTQWLCLHENESRSDRRFGSRSKTWLGSRFELRVFTCLANAFPITIRICALRGNILLLLRSPRVLIDPCAYAWLQRAFLTHKSRSERALRSHVLESGFLDGSRSKTPFFFAFQNAFQKPDLKQLCVPQG